MQVEASLLLYFQALLEHSGEIAGLQGAILSTSGANPCSSMHTLLLRDIDVESSKEMTAVSKRDSRSDSSHSVGAYIALW